MSEPNIKRLGPYQIESILGRGGMGSVFAARHERTQERAALKVLAPALAADEGFRERFIAEIESLKTLNHPHIVKLHGYGEHEGHLYYAMELVEGTNLAQELQGGRRFNWREVTQLAIDIAGALKHAHDHGVIHRDLKPANLLMDRHDQVKLTDFGIAKLFSNTRVTSNGSVLGTADYMAPEQAAGEATTPRCDLFSLGCVMYALLAGRPPFEGKSIAEVVHKVRYEQQSPVTKYAQDVPRDLQRIIDELLEKDPDERIRTALSLMHRLKAIQEALTISTTDREDFYSDAHDRPAGGGNYIGHPPPDIAERPTVILPDADTVSRTGLPKKEKSSFASTGDHFTRVERDSWHAEPRSEFSSAIPLLLLLLAVVGGLVGGIWYSTRPLSADELHAKIMAAAADDDPGDLMAMDKEVNLFISKFSDDPRVLSVEKLSEEIEIYRVQRSLEIMSRGRQETGSLSPAETHCNEAFRAYREGDIEAAITILAGIQNLFGDEDENTDIKIKRVLNLVDRLLPKWKDKLEDEIEGLQVNLDTQQTRAREWLKTDPERSRRIWQGTIDLYNGRSWAQEYIRHAREELSKLDASSVQESAAGGDETPVVAETSLQRINE